MTCAAALPLRLPAGTTPTSFPIVDAHIHLFDPTRPGGVPWPEPTDTVLYRPALPSRYRALAAPEGVLAAIAVECSPLASDNDWLLATAASDPLLVGVIGDLDPALSSFPADLDRLAGNRLFRGIRYGNLWHRDLGHAVRNPTFVEGMRHLSRRGLLLESANPNPALLVDLLRLASAVPDLRLVIDHLPQAVPPEDPTQRSSYLASLKQISERPNIFVKGSEIFRTVQGKVPRALVVYQPWLDTLWELFGEDRLFFGSDWPNSDRLTTFDEVFTLARRYLETHSLGAARKFFCSNSAKVYDWHPRTMAQRHALLPDRSK